MEVVTGLGGHVLEGNPKAQRIRERCQGHTVVISVSGGKDSAATALYFKELQIPYKAVFADTGWEADQTYEYLRGPLESKVGPITWVKHPLGLPGLAKHKGIFPSRLKRWCTDLLKVEPIKAFLALQDDPVSVVGIRAAESAKRAQALEWEWSESLDAWVMRPIHDWTETDVIAICQRHGLAPNPLYLLGAKRVGCWPCIYARKDEIRLIAEHDPKRISRLRVLEEEVTEIARERLATKDEPLRFPRTFSPPRLGRGGEPWPIDRVVEWSKSPGAKDIDVDELAREGCMRWGMCEATPPEDE